MQLADPIAAFEARRGRLRCSTSSLDIRPNSGATLARKIVGRTCTQHQGKPRSVFVRTQPVKLDRIQYAFSPNTAQQAACFSPKIGEFVVVRRKEREACAWRIKSNGPSSPTDFTKKSSDMTRASDLVTSGYQILCICLGPSGLLFIEFSERFALPSELLQERCGRPRLRRAVLESQIRS